jgi:branched-chain amino acid transport system substrate-binding protein
MKIKLLFVFVVIFSFTGQIALDGGNPFKVGALLCLTGECAEPGQNALNGIVLAAKEINLKGGVLGKKIEIVTQDTEEFASASNALSSFRSLISNPEIKYIIGPTWTVGGLPIAPVAAQHKDILITSPSLGVSDFNETADNIFNVWPHDDSATTALAELAISENLKSAVVFSNQMPWEMVQGQAFAKEFKRLGGDVKAILEPLADQDLRAEVLKAKNANPDLIFFSNYTQVHLAAIKLKELGYEGKMFVILLDETRLSGAKGALEGAIVAETQDPKTSFKEAYKAEYNADPGIAADTGYDVMKMYVEAIKNAGSFEASKVIPVFKRLVYEGASGNIKFDEKGGIRRKPSFKIVKDSKKIPYMPKG